MMKEYIIRDKLLEARKQAIFVYENANILNTEAIRSGLKPLLDEIADIPAANVIENIRAEWIEGRVDGRVCVNCSNCGSIIPTDTQVDYLNLEDNKYCYWCGAIMGK